MTMTEWFLAELESEAAKSRRVLEQGPTGKRDWKPHERSMELGGVFAVGDVRCGNIKRVASAVGEGSIAISFVHRVLAE